MRNRRSLLISTSVLVTMIGAIFFAWKPEPSFAQGGGHKLFYLYVHCEDSQLASASFTHTVEAGTGTWTGYVGKCGMCAATLDAALAGLPAGVSAALRAKVDQHQAEAAAGRKSRLTCLGDATKPPEDKKPKCEPPPNSPEPPWMNPEVQCPERTRGIISWKLVPGTRDRSYTVKMCGEVISYILPRGAGPGPRGGGVTASSGEYSNAPGVRGFDVCCDSWRNAANTKSPCDARLDIDCDGMPNNRDRFAEIPLDERGSREFFVYPGQFPPSNSTVYPGRVPPLHSTVYDYLHAPDQSECKDCKWELVRYESTCKNVPNLILSDREGMDFFDAEHKVKATWKCPANGQTKENQETVIMEQVGCPPKPTAPTLRP